MRTFIGVDIPDEAKMKLDALILKFKALGGRVTWVRAANLHLTVKFIGEFMPERLEDLSASLNEELNGYGAQKISLSGLGGFPNLKNPRVLWVGVDEGREWVVELIKRVENGCATLKIPREKKDAEPHLTLGRVRETRGGKRMLEVFGQTSFEYPAFYVNNITIYKSVLTPHGAEYTVLEKISFNK